MAGSTNKLFEHLNRNWEARRQVLESQAHKDQERPGDKNSEIDFFVFKPGLK